MSFLSLYGMYSTSMQLASAPILTWIVERTYGDPPLLYQAGRGRGRGRGRSCGQGGGRAEVVSAE